MGDITVSTCARIATLEHLPHQSSPQRKKSLLRKHSTKHADSKAAAQARQRRYDAMIARIGKQKVVRVRARKNVEGRRPVGRRDNNRGGQLNKGRLPSRAHGGR